MTTNGPAEDVSSDDTDTVVVEERTFEQADTVERPTMPVPRTSPVRMHLATAAYSGARVDIVVADLSRDPRCERGEEPSFAPVLESGILPPPFWEADDADERTG